MRTSAGLAFVLLLTSTAFAGWIGKEAPDFALKTLDGGTSISLKGLRGNIIVVDFWASWCAPCRRSLPKLSALQANIRDVRVVAVNIDDERINGAEFLRRYGINVVSVYDEKKDVVRKYDIPAMPTALILDRKGIVRFVHEGYTDEDIEQFKKEIHGLL